MSVTDLADSYFTAKGIVYSDAETNICQSVMSKLFDNAKVVQYRQIAVPDNTSDDYYMYNFGNNEFIQSLYNVQIGRLQDADELTFEQTSSYTPVTTYENAGGLEVCAIHGDGILFNTETDARNVILEIGYTDKSASKLTQEVRDALKFCYYYLYTENMDGYYNYLRKLSIEKKNTLRENTQTKSTRKIMYSQLTPVSL